MYHLNIFQFLNGFEYNIILCWFITLKITTMQLSEQKTNDRSVQISPIRVTNISFVAPIKTFILDTARATLVFATHHNTTLHQHFSNHVILICSP